MVCLSIRPLAKGDAVWYRKSEGKSEKKKRAVVLSVDGVSLALGEEQNLVVRFVKDGSEWETVASKLSRRAVSD